MSPVDVVLSTGNDHKVREISELLAAVPIRVRSPAELGLDMDVPEDGSSYEENALKKAIAAAAAARMPAMADDSGIEVDALEGAPGILSARFAGPDADDAANNAYLLARLDGVPAEERTARYICVAVLVVPEAEAPIAICRWEWEGAIALCPAGRAGFGYDPLFLIPQEGATVAQLGEAYKREHSHRAGAFRQLVPHLEVLARG